MRRFLFIVFCVFTLGSSLAANDIYFHIMFSSPLHTVGQVPATGNATARVSQISFGSPMVVRQLGELKDQPLVLNTAGNRPHYYYDQVVLKVDKEAPFYYVAFDLYTQYLIGSTNHFSVLFDTPSVRSIRFDSDGMIRAFVPHEPIHEIHTFEDMTLMHCKVHLDMNEDTWAFFVNDRKVYIGPFNPLDDISTIRFSLGLESSNHDRIMIRLSGWTTSLWRIMSSMIRLQ